MWRDVVCHIAAVLGKKAAGEVKHSYVITTSTVCVKWPIVQTVQPNTLSTEQSRLAAACGESRCMSTEAWPGGSGQAMQTANAVMCGRRAHPLADADPHNLYIIIGSISAWPACDWYMQRRGHGPVEKSLSVKRGAWERRRRTATVVYSLLLHHQRHLIRLENSPLAKASCQHDLKQSGVS